MAKILLDAPVAAIGGSISKHQNVIYRTRNGRTHAYVVTHPNELPQSETQKRNFLLLELFPSRYMLKCQILSSVQSGKSLLQNILRSTILRINVQSLPTTTIPILLAANLSLLRSMVISSTPSTSVPNPTPPHPIHNS